MISGLSGIPRISSDPHWGGATEQLAQTPAGVKPQNSWQEEVKIPHSSRTAFSFSKLFFTSSRNIIATVHDTLSHSKSRWDRTPPHNSPPPPPHLHGRVTWLMVTFEVIGVVIVHMCPTFLINFVSSTSYFCSLLIFTRTKHR